MTDASVELHLHQLAVGTFVWLNLCSNIQNQNQRAGVGRVAKLEGSERERETKRLRKTRLDKLHNRREGRKEKDQRRLTTNDEHLPNDHHHKS